MYLFISYNLFGVNVFWTATHVVTLYDVCFKFTFTTLEHTK